MTGKTSQQIRVEHIAPDPDQPRKHFNADAIAELGASIQENGLIQPISVRRDPKNEARFIIVAGERRWRAHCAIGAATIDAIVLDGEQATESTPRAILQLIENMQRADMTPLEEAEAFKRIIDESGLTPEALGKRLGFTQPWRVQRRLDLLNIKPEYARLAVSGQLPQAVALEMAKLDHRQQDMLFAAVKTGTATKWADLRAVRAVVESMPTQCAMFEAPAAPTRDEKVSSTRLERAIDDVVRLCSDCFRENEIVALAKVQPHNVKTYADKLDLAAKTLQRVAVEMRKERFTRDLLAGAAAQGSVGAASAA